MSPVTRTLLVVPLTLAIGTALSALAYTVEAPPAPVATPPLAERKAPSRPPAVRCTKGVEWPRCYIVRGDAQ